MTIGTPVGLMIDQLRDLASAQQQLVESQPVLLGLSTHAGLKALLRQHHEETKANVTTLRGVLVSLQAEPNDDVCQAMGALLRGGRSTCSPCRNRLSATS